MGSEVYFMRTEMGNSELFGTERTLKPRERQLLFLISEPISEAALKEKIPSCKELESILFFLSDNGFIKAVTPTAGSQPAAVAPGHAKAAPPPPPPSSAGPEKIQAAKDHVLGVLASLVGTRSPVYNKMAQAGNMDDFMTALAACKKTLGAVASPTQAAALESEAMNILNA